MRRIEAMGANDSGKRVKLHHAIPLQKALEIADRMKKDGFREAIMFLSKQIRMREMELVGFECIREKNGRVEFRDDRESALKSMGQVNHVIGLMNEITILNEKKAEIGSGYAFTDAFKI